MHIKSVVVAAMKFKIYFLADNKLFALLPAYLGAFRYNTNNYAKTI